MIIEWLRWIFAIIVVVWSISLLINGLKDISKINDIINKNK